MGAKLDLPRLQRVARHQWGVVTRRQLVFLGFSARGIEEWVRTGRLARIHRGVYAFGHDRLTTEGRWLAAVMACGRGAVLSHRSAAQLWEIRQNSSALVDVTVPSQNGRFKRAGIRIHRSARLGSDEVTTRRGIPVTTVARTLLDLADVVDEQALRRTVTEAAYRDLFDLTTLTAVVQANPGRRRAKLMRAVEAAGHRTRSPLEDRFLRFMERRGVEEAETNVWLEGYEVDFLWRRVGLVVELDGLDEHGTRAAVRRDRKRDRELWRAGFRTVRLTDDALDDEHEVLRDLIEAGVRVAGA
jgi:very-short-patch-repair endonuclease